MTGAVAPQLPGGVFLGPPSRRLFCMQHPGRKDVAAIFVPPFAEEANRSRRTWALLGRCLSAHGVTTLLPDLGGTGESAGEFVHARWEDWLTDLETTLDQARRDGMRRCVLVGLRLGATLAVEFVRRSAAPEVCSLILWQPVAQGRQFVNQFLRVKLAAGLRSAGAERLTTADLRKQLEAAGVLEVAGYALAPELVAAVDGIDLATQPPPAAVSVDWIDIVSGEAAQLTPGSARVLDAWQRAGAHVRGQALRGEAFWSLQEVTIVPPLIDLTARLAQESLHS